MFSNEFLRDSSLIDLHLDSGIVSLVRPRWVKGVCVFRYNLRPCTFEQITGVFYLPLQFRSDGTDTKYESAYKAQSGE